MEDARYPPRCGPHHWHENERGEGLVIKTYGEPGREFFMCADCYVETWGEPPASPGAEAGSSGEQGVGE